MSSTSMISFSEVSLSGCVDAHVRVGQGSILSVTYEEGVLIVLLLEGSRRGRLKGRTLQHKNLEGFSPQKD